MAIAERDGKRLYRTQPPPKCPKCQVNMTVTETRKLIRRFRCPVCDYRCKQARQDVVRDK